MTSRVFSCVFEDAIEEMGRLANNASERPGYMAESVPPTSDAWLLAAIDLGLDKIEGRGATSGIDRTGKFSDDEMVWADILLRIVHAGRARGWRLGEAVNEVFRLRVAGEYDQPECSVQPEDSQ